MAEIKEKKVPVRSIVFNNVDDCMNAIVKKEYECPEDIALTECETNLPKKIMLLVQGKAVIAIREFPVAQFDLGLFTPVEGETEDEVKQRADTAQKTFELMNAMLEKESVRLGKADVAVANFEAFLDIVTATRATVDITVEETKNLIKDWLSKNNKALKERGKQIFFESASRLIDSIKSDATAQQIFAGSDPANVDKLVKLYYEALCREFNEKEKATTLLDKWYKNRVAKSTSATKIVLDDLDDLI